MQGWRPADLSKASLWCRHNYERTYPVYRDRVDSCEAACSGASVSGNGEPGWFSFQLPAHCPQHTWLWDICVGKGSGVLGVEMGTAGAHTGKRRRPRAAGGFVNVVVGDGGNEEGVQRNFLGQQPAWSAFRDTDFGVASFVVVNTTFATWTWRADNGTLVDQVSWLMQMLQPLITLPDVSAATV